MKLSDVELTDINGVPYLVVRNKRGNIKQKKLVNEEYNSILPNKDDCVVEINGALHMSIVRKMDREQAIVFRYRKKIKEHNDRIRGEKALIKIQSYLGGLFRG